MNLLKIIREEIRNLNREGVADKFAEKQFHIPNPNTAMDVRAKAGIQKDIDKPYVYIQDNNENIPIFKNPKSLRNFDDNIRAIIDEQGNLYVAQKDGYFNHGEMGNTLFPQEGRWTGGMNGVYAKFNKYIMLHRVDNTNKFGLADSSSDFVDRSNVDKKIIEKLLLKTKQVNPQFNFYVKYYKYIEDYDSPVSDF